MQDNQSELTKMALTTALDGFKVVLGAAIGSFSTILTSSKIENLQTGTK